MFAWKAKWALPCELHAVAVLDHGGEDGHIISLSSEVTLVSAMASPNRNQKMMMGGRYGILQVGRISLLHFKCAVHKIQWGMGTASQVSMSVNLKGLSIRDSSWDT